MAFGKLKEMAEKAKDKKTKLALTAQEMRDLVDSIGTGGAAHPKAKESKPDTNDSAATFMGNPGSDDAPKKLKRKKKSGRYA